MRLEASVALSVSGLHTAFIKVAQSVFMEKPQSSAASQSLFLAHGESGTQWGWVGGGSAHLVEDRG